MAEEILLLQSESESAVPTCPSLRFSESLNSDLSLTEWASATKWACIGPRPKLFWAQASTFKSLFLSPTKNQENSILLMNLTILALALGSFVPEVKMANCSCSFKWWHAPIFFAVSVVLAFFAISTALHDSSQTATQPNKAIGDELSLNASVALRRAGFHVIARLLQVSPEHFFSAQYSTIFAMKDSAISNAYLPPWLLKNLVKYHTSPSKLSMADLLKKPQGICLPTLLTTKKIAITRMNSSAGLVEINHVPVTHPDIFLGGNVSIHGVLGPFSPLDPLDVRQGWSFIQAPFCNSNSTLVSDTRGTKNGVEWRRIIRWLSANGFVSFAIGLQSVLEGILQDFEGLRAITVFAPPNLASVASPSPLLKRAVRLHIVPQMVTYKALASFPAKTLLKTLVAGQDLEVLGGVRVPRGTVVVNGVEIVAPEIFRSENYVIHGISRSINVAGLPHESR